MSLEDAEDIVMDAFMDMVRALEPGDYSYAWLSKAAISNLLKYKEKREKEKARNGGQLPIRIDDHNNDSRALGGEDPRLGELESALWRDEVFSGLPPKQREVMACFAADFDDTKTARTLGISEEAVRKSRSAARESLRKIILPDGRYRNPGARAAVQGRSLSRAAERAVAAAESLTVSRRDLRSMEPGERAEAAAGVRELERLLRGSRAGAFGAEASVAVLKCVASLARERVSDRDEREAFKLIQVARPHLEFVGPRPAAFDLQRTRAEALCEIGHPEKAVQLLRGLSTQEKQAFGAVTPKTAVLLLWAQAMAGQVALADRGFSELAARLAKSPADVEMLLHVQCRHFWVRGQGRRVSESASGYDSVINDRSWWLGPDHPDALDARHSKGKMLVANGAGAQAVTILGSVAEVRARVQGDWHPDTLESVKYLHLAQVQQEPRDDRIRREAIIALDAISHSQVSRHGRDYPMSRDTADWLGWLRRGAGKPLL
ncbi:MAG: RNA polymerase sigma factor [Trebonia sp.]